MKIALSALAVSYILSQFFRAYLAVLAPDLAADIGAGPDDLSEASSWFFLAFAAAQIPVGWSLDHFGPRRTAALPFALFGGGGALVVASAQSPVGVELGMALIGLGMSPVLMASYFIILRTYPPAIFASFAGAFVAFGSLGNLFGTIPLAAAVEWIGWRHSMQVVGGLTLIGAASIWIFVRDPERTPGPMSKGGFTELLRMPALWPIMAMILVAYAPAISLRGVWMGPYLEDTFGLTTRQIGWATMGMALAMMVSLLALGPISRVLGRPRTLVVGCSLVSAIGIAALPFAPGVSSAIALFVVIGLLGSTYPLIVSHGMQFVPKHLTGRGTSLLNLFSIGGVSLLQWLAARVYSGSYNPVFWTIAVFLAAGTIVSLFSREKPE